MRIDEVIAELEATAQSRGLTKRALAELAGVHPNSLRSFRAHGSRRGRHRRRRPWSPTLAILRKVEQALKGPTPKARTRTQPTATISQGNGEAQA